MAEANPNLTERDVQTYAALMLTADAFAEIIRRIKADILRKWASEPNSTARDALYYDIQAVGRFEAKLRTLAEAKVMDERKAEAPWRRG